MTAKNKNNKKKMTLLGLEDIGGIKGRNLLFDALNIKCEHGGYLLHKDKRVKCIQCGKSIRAGMLSIFGRDFLCNNPLCITEYITIHNIVFNEV